MGERRDTDLAVAVAEAQAWLRQVDGSTLQLGYAPGIDAWEAVLFDHPHERAWSATAGEPGEAIQRALDLWHVDHPGTYAPVGGDGPPTREVPASRAPGWLRPLLPPSVLNDNDTTREGR